MDLINLTLFYMPENDLSIEVYEEVLRNDAMLRIQFKILELARNKCFETLNVTLELISQEFERVSSNTESDTSSVQATAKLILAEEFLSTIINDFRSALQNITGNIIPINYQAISDSIS